VQPALSEVGPEFIMHRGEQRGNYVRVTPRQLEILKLSSKGQTEKEIAQQLGVSPATVRTHLERFYKSNGLRNKAEAIAFWLRADSKRRSSRRR